MVPLAMEAMFALSVLANIVGFFLRGRLHHKPPPDPALVAEVTALRKKVERLDQERLDLCDSLKRKQEEFDEALQTHRDDMEQLKCKLESEAGHAREAKHSKEITVLEKRIAELMQQLRDAQENLDKERKALQQLKKKAEEERRQAEEQRKQAKEERKKLNDELQQSKRDALREHRDLCQVKEEIERERAANLLKDETILQLKERLAAQNDELSQSLAIVDQLRKVLTILPVYINIC